MTRAEPRPRRRGPGQRARRRLLWAATVLVLLSLGVLAAAAFWARRPGPGTGALVEIDWPANPGASAAGELLERAGLIRSRQLFAAYLMLAGASSELEPGMHLLNDALSPREIVQRLGRVSSRRAVKLTIPEGYNHLQIAERLQASQICSAQGFRRAVRDQALLAELGIGAPSLEGYLFPATYELLVDTTPATIARQLARETRRRLEKLRLRHPDGVARLERDHGFRETEILNLASIVERESADPAERKTIAGVFFNRLTNPDFRPKGTLQSDPTAVYGCLIEPETAPSCQGFRGRVSPAVLRDPANRYNTYRHAGLPPGPIANPGEGAIEAVLDPSRTDYLFFFARGDRRHTFTRTFEEHRAVVRGSGAKTAPDEQP